MDVKNTMIFTIGRMNPPTSGHIKLIQTLMEASLSLDLGDKGRGRVYIILSHTKDNTKNPLSCDRKKGLLIIKGMIDKLKQKELRGIKPFAEIVVTALCTYEPNEFSDECGKTFITSQLCRIIKAEQKRKHPITNAEIILGADRQGKFGQLPGYFQSQKIIFNEIGPDGRRLFQKYDDELQRNEAYIDDPTKPIDPENMSGTLIRSLVETKQEGRFIDLYETVGLSRDEAITLYHELANELSGKSHPVKTVKHKPASKAKGSSATKATKATKAKGSSASRSNSSSPIETNSASPIEASAVITPPTPTNARRGRSATAKGGGYYRGRTIKRNKNPFTLANFIKKLGM